MGTIRQDATMENFLNTTLDERKFPPTKLDITHIALKSSLDGNGRMKIDDEDL